ncbi:hypothetical protein BH10BAC5_BH10BAC5_15320 [soil metagenome]
MNKHLESLSSEEKSMLFNVPALVAVLVAGADGNIDKKELSWSEKIIHFRANYKDSILHDFYVEVEKYIHDSVQDFISKLPQDTNERQGKINTELEKVNDILEKLDKKFAEELYHSFHTFARQVAKASGGVIGYGAITPSEERVLGLDALRRP